MKRRLKCTNYSMYETLVTPEVDPVRVYSMYETQITPWKWILSGSIACPRPRLPSGSGSCQGLQHVCDPDYLRKWILSESIICLRPRFPRKWNLSVKSMPETQNSPPPPEMDPVGVYSMSETQFTPEVDPVRVFSRSVIRIIGCILTAPENYNHL